MLLKSPVRKIRTPGSVQGASSNRCPYCDRRRNRIGLSPQQLRNLNETDDDDVFLSEVNTKRPKKNKMVRSCPGGMDSQRVCRSRERGMCEEKRQRTWDTL